MTKRGPTDTDRQNGEADVEVVNAAGERKAASLPKRLLAAARDTVSMTDEQNDPSWTDELADPEQTIVTGNPAVTSHADHVNEALDFDAKHGAGRVPPTKPGRSERSLRPDDQPPAKVMRELRTRAHSDVEDRVGMAAAKVAGLVELDRWMRTYAVNVQHLASFAVLIQDAVEVLQDRQIPNAELRGRFRQQIDEWEHDSGDGSR